MERALRAPGGQKYGKVTKKEVAAEMGIGPSSVIAIFPIGSHRAYFVTKPPRGHYGALVYAYNRSEDPRAYGAPQTVFDSRKEAIAYAAELKIDEVRGE